jgi:hypothetical protein
MSKVTLAIDPGGTTGLCWQSTDWPLKIPYLTATANSAEKVWECVDSAFIRTVIYEQFSTKYISKHGLHTVRVIGGIQALCMHYNIPCIPRTAQSRIAFLDDAKAILTGKGESFTEHQKDALAHMLSYEHEMRLYGRILPSSRRKSTQGLEHYERSHA